jgi:UDP-GlcNAc:undecaprenyl-phosphate GlcNAc-1-phosphate transferase
MGSEMARVATFFCAPVFLSVVSVLLLSRFAFVLGVVDVPGGRKSHGGAVPLVGGLSIFFSVLAVSWLFGIAHQAGFFLLALSFVIAVGLWDDVAEIRPRLKFAIQIIASAIMIWGAGVQLISVGDLLGWRPLGLWMFSIPMTIFAVVGVVNSVNMMDGLDGLAGSIAFVAFAWYAAVAAASGLDVQFQMAALFCCAICGFLLFNLRFPWQQRARVFLGDAGSLMIGFALGWFAIDLTQGQNRTFPPIAALWVLLLPLADCVSLMTRRLMGRKSPFIADSHHIHHYLLARGFTHGQTLALLVVFSVAFGAVGYFGWRANLPESFLFWPFVLSFFVYHIWISHAWKLLDEEGQFVETATFAPHKAEGTDTKGIPIS